MIKGVCPFQGNTAAPSTGAVGSSWAGFRKSLLPARDSTEIEGADSRNRIPPAFEEYMGAIAPFFLQAVSGSVLRIPSEVLNPRISATKTADGHDLYVPNDKLYIQFGAKNVDQVSFALQEVLIHCLERVFKEIEASGFRSDLQKGVEESRAKVLLSLVYPFPVAGGIGTAVSTTINSFAALLKLADQNGLLKMDNKNGIFTYHPTVAQGLALLDIESINGFSEAVVAKPKSEELFDFQQSIVKDPYRNLIPADASTGDPWDLKHFYISEDSVGGVKLEIDPKFTPLEIIGMKSPVAKPAGCPYKKYVPPLSRRIMELAWDVVAVPMIRREISI
jgi:hypothetical protein